MAEKKLWFGLLQGAFEHEMLASTIAAIGGDPTTVETTSARLSNDGVVVLAAAEPVAVGSPAAASRIRGPTGSFGVGGELDCRADRRAR